MSSFKVVSAVLLVSLALSACQTNDAYTGKSKVNKATAYGGIGAVLCGIIGAQRGSNEARNAALACGIAGAGIGAYMDAQEKQLRDELVGSGVQVEREGDQIRLVMPNNITFAVDKSTLSPSIYPTLSSVVKVLAKFNETQLRVAGHTDSSGSEAYNRTLSIARANSVTTYLIGQNLDSTRLITAGYGESQPIANNNTAAGRAENRRVELLIEAKPST